MITREQIIREGLNRWVDNKFNGILRYATGVGKSYACILSSEHFIKSYPKANVLIVCPTDVVIQNLKKEFIKFKKKALLSNCEFICYASLHKVEKKYSLVVFDEIHHLTTDLKLQFFKTRKYLGLLGLSASLTPLQIKLLAPYIRIVHTITTEQARKLGFISDFTIINYGVELTPKELYTYKNLTSAIDYTQEEYNSNNWKAIGKRSNLLYNAENKFKMILPIVECFKNEYGIIFSLTKEQTDKISELIGDTCVSIHSGKTKADKELLTKIFLDGRTKVNKISTAKMFDEGVTIKNLSFGLLVSRYSKERQGIQNVGRLVRTDMPDKHSIVVRLYVKDTKEEEWVRKSQKSFNVIYVDSYEKFKHAVETARNKSQ